MPPRYPPRITRCGASALALAIACGWAGPLAAGPKGGVVAHGDAAIISGGQVTAIKQSSDRIIIDWQSFDIGADEAVRFDQPGRGSVALNRIKAGNPSAIDGRIEANGNVWIVNPSGVMFGHGARIDVGGLIVSTTDISDENFTKGNMVFNRPGDPGAQIVNDGAITFAEAGLAGFVAPEVINRGQITGRLGRITIAGKDSFSVDISGDGMFALDLSDAAPAAHARLVNQGLIDVAGGVVVIDAASVRDAVDGTVSAGGVVSAASADVDGGTIVLTGGRIEASGVIDASSGTGIGGTVAMTGDLVHVQAGALVDASGARGGGIVRIGALAPDAAPMPARRTLVAAGATVRANADVSGTGGDVLVWGEDASMVRGTLFAVGAQTGGRIEISSPADILFTGTADASGAVADGLILIDPAFLTIGLIGPNDPALSDSKILAGEGGAGSYTIAATTLNGLSGKVLLQASDTIRVEQEIAFGGDLTLEAGRDILLFADIHAGGALLLSANAAVAGAPAITNGSIRITDGRSISAGGALTLRTGATGRLDGSAMLTSDVLRLSAGGNLTASAMTLSGALSAESYGTANLSKNMMISGDVDVITHGGALVFASLKGAVSGAVTLNARGGGAVAGDVTMQVGGALNLAGLDAHNANVLATGGILGDGVMSVSGVSTFQANGFAVALTNVGNSFGGEVRAISLSPSGTAIGDVDINASGNLVIGQLVGDAARLRAGGAISQTGDVTVAGDADIAAVGNIA
ncbi:MAG: filamentous hemagglutinin family protein, partial [Paracoccaceae bacterium]